MFEATLNDNADAFWAFLNESFCHIKSTDSETFQLIFFLFFLFDRYRSSLLAGTLHFRTLSIRAGNRNPDTLDWGNGKHEAEIKVKQKMVQNTRVKLQSKLLNLRLS